MSKTIGVMNATYNYKGVDGQYSFFTDIDVLRKAKFVESVCSYVVTDKSYQAVLRDTIFMWQIIEAFTNINLKDVLNLEESQNALGDIIDFVEETDVVENIVDNMRAGLIQELNETVNLNIEYKTGIHIDPLRDMLANLLKSLEDKMNEIDIPTLMNFASKINEIPDELSADKIAEACANSDAFKKLVDGRRNIEKDDKVVDIVEAAKKKATKATKTTKKKTTAKTTKKKEVKSDIENEAEVKVDTEESKE